MTKPLISIGALGGTISMTSATTPGQGVTSKLGAAELAASVPGLNNIAELRLHTIYKVASSSIEFAHLLQVLEWAQAEVAQGSKGVVITQGTDSLEETAFFMDLLWDRPEPLVMMGAMRNPDMAGAEGSANLLASVITAACDKSRNKGVLVVMNDIIHEAKRVRKTNTVSVDTFQSPLFGPIGQVVENKTFYFNPSYPQAKKFSAPAQIQDKVLLLEHCLDDYTDIIQYAVNSGYKGIVIAGFGSGHTSVKMRDALVQAAQSIPVVVCSRTGSGSTTESVYGYVGAELDLKANGILMGKYLCPRKTRLLLLMCIWHGYSKVQIAQAIENWATV